jgi:hypothetical protein
LTPEEFIDKLIQTLLKEFPMHNISKTALIVGISFLTTFPALCEDASKTAQPQKET